MPGRRVMFRRGPLLSLIAALFLLAGCASMIHDPDADKGGMLAQSSYAAADMMIQQSRTFITPDTPLEIGVLTDLDNPNERTNFGSMVAEQIASRFVQLGYNVTVGDMSAGYDGNAASQGADGTFASPAPAAASSSGRSVITGRYAVARNAVLVNLRLIDASAGKMLAAYDYSVPKTADIRELTKTKADKDSFLNF